MTAPTAGDQPREVDKSPNADRCGSEARLTDMNFTQFFSLFPEIDSATRTASSSSVLSCWSPELRMKLKASLTCPLCARLLRCNPTAVVPCGHLFCYDCINCATEEGFGNSQALPWPWSHQLCPEVQRRIASSSTRKKKIRFTCPVCLGPSFKWTLVKLPLVEEMCSQLHQRLPALEGELRQLTDADVVERPPVASLSQDLFVVDGRHGLDSRVATHEDLPTDPARVEANAPRAGFTSASALSPRSATRPTSQAASPSVALPVLRVTNTGCVDDDRTTATTVGVCAPSPGNVLPYPTQCTMDVFARPMMAISNRSGRGAQLTEPPSQSGGYIRMPAHDSEVPCLAQVTPRCGPDEEMWPDHTPAGPEEEHRSPVTGVDCNLLGASEDSMPIAAAVTTESTPPLDPVSLTNAQTTPSTPPLVLYLDESFPREQNNAAMRANMRAIIKTMKGVFSAKLVDDVHNRSQYSSVVHATLSDAMLVSLDDAVSEVTATSVRYPGKLSEHSFPQEPVCACALREVRLLFRESVHICVGALESSSPGDEAPSRQDLLVASLSPAWCTSLVLGGWCVDWQWMAQAVATHERTPLTSYENMAPYAAIGWLPTHRSDRSCSIETTNADTHNAFTDLIALRRHSPRGSPRAVQYADANGRCHPGGWIRGRGTFFCLPDAHLATFSSVICEAIRSGHDPLSSALAKAFAAQLHSCTADSTVCGGHALSGWRRLVLSAGGGWVSVSFPLLVALSVWSLEEGPVHTAGDEVSIQRLRSYLARTLLRPYNAWLLADHQQSMLSSPSDSRAEAISSPSLMLLYDADTLKRCLRSKGKEATARSATPESPLRHETKALRHHVQQLLTRISEGLALVLRCGGASAVFPSSPSSTWPNLFSPAAGEVRTAAWLLQNVAENRRGPGWLARTRGSERTSSMSPYKKNRRAEEEHDAVTPQDKRGKPPAIPTSSPPSGRPSVSAGMCIREPPPPSPDGSAPSLPATVVATIDSLAVTVPCGTSVWESMTQQSVCVTPRPVLGIYRNLLYEDTP